MNAAIDSAGSVLLRTGYAAALPATASGATLAPALGLRFALAGWGAIEIHDRLPLRRGPAAASVTPMGGKLVFEASKSIEVFVTSRAPRPVEGTLRVLATTDWKIGPAQQFRFTLRRPDKVRVPRSSSTRRSSQAGHVRVRDASRSRRTAGRQLRAQVVKPVQWVVIGPFRHPQERRSWDRSPVSASNPVTRVSTAFRSRGRRCPRKPTTPTAVSISRPCIPISAARPACAFTVFDAPETSGAVLDERHDAHLVERRDAGCRPPVRVLQGRNRCSCVPARPRKAGRSIRRCAMRAANRYASSPTICGVWWRATRHSVALHRASPVARRRIAS